MSILISIHLVFGTTRVILRMKLLVKYNICNIHTISSPIISNSWVYTALVWQTTQPLPPDNNVQVGRRVLGFSHLWVDHNCWAKAGRIFREAKAWCSALSDIIDLSPSALPPTCSIIPNGWVHTFKAPNSCQVICWKSRPQFCCCHKRRKKP